MPARAGKRTRSTLHPTCDCTSPHSHDWSSGAGDALASSSASQSCCSVRTAHRLEVSNVVDAGDHRATFSLLDQRDGGVLDPEGEQTATISSDDTVQRDLDHAPMRDDQNVSV